MAIGNYAGHTSQQTKTIVLNATDISLNADISNAFYVKPIRNVDTNDKRLTYDSSRGEITWESNTIAQIHDVSANSAETGMVLIYDAPSAKWEARQRDYYLLSVNGDISGSILSNATRNLFILDSSASWTKIASRKDFTNNIIYTSSNGRFALSTGKLYKISCKFMAYIDAISSALTVSLGIFNSSNLIISTSNNMKYAVTDTNLTLITDCYASGTDTTYVYALVGSQSGNSNYTEATLSDGIITMDIQEI